MKKKINILIFTSYLGSGGAEKHVVRLVNHLDYSLFNVELILPKKSGSYEAELSREVKVTKVGLPLGRLSSTLMRLTCLFPLSYIIQKRKPDILFSVMDIHNLIAVQAVKYARHRPHLVLGIQNSITDLYQNSGWMGQQILRRIPTYYNKADKIVALSHGVADNLLSLSPELADKVTVIYNCGYDDFLMKQLGEQRIDRPNPDIPLLVACGRLEPQKGYPYLLKALALVLKEQDCHLWVIGQGREREMLQNMAQQLGISEHIEFLGFKSNPYSYIAAADLFVLSSLHEGFGNVIVEAMVCGTAVVSTDCPHGPNEIIVHNHNGFLTAPADEKQLAEAIISVLKDKALQKQFSQQAEKSATQYHAQQIANEYQDLFLNVCN